QLLPVPFVSFLHKPRTVSGALVIVPYPPIPDRRWDWCAVDDDTYDADYDSERGFYSNCPIGYGATEQEAIDDLLMPLCERDETIRALPQELLDRACALVGEIDLDSDVPIIGAVAV